MGLNFREEVLKLRHNKNISQSDVGRLMGYGTSQFVSNWERGISVAPIKDIPQLSAILSPSVEKAKEIEEKLTIAAIEDTLIKKAKVLGKDAYFPIQYKIEVKKFKA